MGRWDSVPIIGAHLDEFSAWEGERDSDATRPAH